MLRIPTALKDEKNQLRLAFYSMAFLAVLSTVGGQYIFDKYQEVLGWNQPSPRPPWDNAQQARLWPNRPMYVVRDNTYIPKNAPPFLHRGPCLPGDHRTAMVINHNGLEIKVKDMGDSWGFKLHGTPNTPGVMEALVEIGCVPDKPPETKATH